MSLLDRLKHAWNAFIYRDNTNGSVQNDLGYSSSFRPDAPVFTRGNERSIVTSVYNRIAIDCSSIPIRHVDTDDNGRYIGDRNSTLNTCLTLEANKDQTGRAFIQDVVESLFDEGEIAIVPIDTDHNPERDDSYDILSMRVGRIVTWYPDYVELEVYNDRSGRKENIIVAKADCGIIQNPLYSIMNAPNSTLQRLIRKLNLLDAIDEQSGAGKLDLIIQLPYIIKTEERKKQAEKRRADIEEQLSSSKYGIAYTDGTEHVTQLNRPIENNLMQQITYLTQEVYGQLGITLEILNGTANEEAMLNYMNRTVEPIMGAIVDELNRKFLSKTAYTQGQRIKYFNDPFRLISVFKLAEIADKFTRNEIMSTNEVRQVIGMKPVDDPKADELRNKNITPGDEQQFANTNENPNNADANTEADLEALNTALDELGTQLGEQNQNG